MPCTPVAYAYTPVNYVGKSGSIPALLLFERDGLCYLRIQTKSWPHYPGWGLWTTAGIWSEHVVKADPHEPGVADLLQELERDLAAHQQQRSNKRIHVSKSKQENGQGVPAPKVAHSNDVKPPATRREPSGGEPNEKKFSSRKSADPEILKKYGPTRTIGGLSLRDFLGK